MIGCARAMLLAMGALVACGEVTRNASDAGDVDGDGSGMSATGSVGIGGMAGTGGTVSTTDTGMTISSSGGTGGGKNPTKDPCSMIEVAPGDLCVRAPCGISRGLEISCDRVASAFSVGLADDIGYAAFMTTLQDSTNVLELIEWRPGELSTAILTNVDGGRILQGALGVTHLVTLGGEYYRLGDDNQIGDPINLGEVLFVVDSILDDAGMVHFLARAAVEGAPWVILGSDGSRRQLSVSDSSEGWLVLGEPVDALLAQTMISAASGLDELQLIYADNGVSQPSFVIPIEAGDSTGRLRPARYARAVAVDFFPGGAQFPAPTQAISKLAYLHESTQSIVYEAQLMDIPCAGRMTVGFPDVCPQGSTSQLAGVGAPQGAFALADTADGDIWLAMLEGSVTSECRWATLSGCFETLPCDCAQVLNHSFELYLKLYRAPDFESPVLMAVVPGVASQASLEMVSQGDRLSILVHRHEASSTAWWFEVDKRSL
jgi:hypothetical protein